MFIYSLPFFFGQIALLSPLEFGLIVLVLAVFLWLTTASVEPEARLWQSQIQPTLRQFLQDAWLGRKSLWKVFWPFFVFLNLALFYLDFSIKRGEFTASSWDAAHFMLVTPILFWTYCVWRNAGNCTHKVWPVLAKLATLAVFFEYALKLFIRLEFAREYFNCHGLLVDYTACF